MKLHSHLLRCVALTLIVTPLTAITVTENLTAKANKILRPSQYKQDRANAIHAAQQVQAAQQEAQRTLMAAMQKQAPVVPTAPVAVEKSTPAQVVPAEKKSKTVAEIVKAAFAQISDVLSHAQKELEEVI